MQENIDISMNNIDAPQLNQDPAMRKHEALSRNYMDMQDNIGELRKAIEDKSSQ